MDVFVSRRLMYTFAFSIAGDSSLFSVHDFSATESLSQPFLVSVDLATRDRDVDFDKILEQDAVLAITDTGPTGGEPRYFYGKITSLRQRTTSSRDALSHGHSLYTATIEPDLALMRLTSDCRIFQQLTVRQIVDTILNEANITNVRWYNSRTLMPREYCVMYSETHFDFVQRLLAEEGFWYYFQHDKEKNTLVIVDRTEGALLLKPEEIEYNGTPGGNTDKAFVYDFAFSKALGTGHTTQRDYTFKNPRYDLEGRASAKQDKTRALYACPGRYKHGEVGADFTKLWLEEQRALLAHGEGHSNIHQLMPGGVTKLIDYRPDLDGRYLLVSVTHSGSQPQSLDEGAGNGASLYNNTFVCIPEDIPYRPERKVKPVIDGPQIATVVGPESEEIYVDEFARVKVQFPWDRYGQNNENASCWIRVAQNWAGPMFGHIAIPRIGQEVIIEYLDGDIDQPLLSGRTYHAVNRTPYKLPALKTQTTVKSKEHKGSGYNELLIDDTTGEIKAQLRTTHDTTQLTLGYLTHPRTPDGKGEHRGDGFELRTDSWGAIRAGKGLYLSADERKKAQGMQLDLQEAITQMENLLRVARNLARGAETAQVPPAAVDAQADRLESVYKDLKQAGLLASAPEGIALVTPQSVQIGSGVNVGITSQASTDISGWQDIRLAARERVSVLSVDKDMTLVSNKGPVRIEAQANTMNITSEKTLEICSTEDRIVVSADKEILLASGGAYVSIKDGNISIHAPGTIDHKATAHPFSGPASMSPPLTPLPSEAILGSYNRQYQFMDDEGNPQANASYIAFLPDGKITKGKTNDKGLSEIFYSDESQKIDVRLSVDEHELKS